MKTRRKYTIEMKCVKLFTNREHSAIFSICPDADTRLYTVRESHTRAHRQMRYPNVT